mgnify:CR=1 FL=1
MKSINLCLLFLTLFTIMSCTTPNTDIEIQTSPIQLDVENYGNYHNEAVLSVIQSESSKNSIVTIGDLIKLMEDNMKRLHPEEFSSIDYTAINQIFDLNQNIDDFNYNDKFFNKLVELGTKNGVVPEMVKFITDAYYNNRILSKGFSELNLSSKDTKFSDQMKIFESFYNASKELWTNDATYKYLLKNNFQTALCDPNSQVILADAVVGFFGALLTGPGGVLVGGAASLIVRTAQVEEENGGCI